MKEYLNWPINRIHPRLTERLLRVGVQFDDLRFQTKEKKRDQNSELLYYKGVLIGKSRMIAPKSSYGSDLDWNFLSLEPWQNCSQGLWNI